MDTFEIAAWASAADWLEQAEVGSAGEAARAEWLFRVSLPAEYWALSTYRDDGTITPRIAGDTAGNVAVELAIICRIWPRSLDVALCRSRPSPL